jgi:hypothetical protein
MSLQYRVHAGRIHERTEEPYELLVRLLGSEAVTILL